MEVLIKYVFSCFCHTQEDTVCFLSRRDVVNIQNQNNFWRVKLILKNLVNDTLKPNDTVTFKSNETNFRIIGLCQNVSKDREMFKGNARTSSSELRALFF